ncbi:MAG: HAD-IIB family hydrolase [Desulfobulbus sp.]|nr:HAD-IIB family hydrolase [Desulfobulbus sp.]
MNRLLLCTDMDRTLIPNGHQPEHPRARELFQQLCTLPQLSLVYVTGRDLHLTEQAIAEYQLPIPAYAITDVGTRIYEHNKGQWRELVSWQEQIAPDWAGKNHAQLKEALDDIQELTLQEVSKQNAFKVSFYLGLDADQERVMGRVGHCLAQLGVDASLIWSIDEPQQIGLLDVLPRNATKLHGIEFLAWYLGYHQDEILFAGDSGNDLMVMGSSIRSILVANADTATKEQALNLAQQNGVRESLYLAQSDIPPLGGNYAAGVLQGMAFFAPEIVRALDL